MPAASVCRVTLSDSSRCRISRADFPLLTPATGHSIPAALLRWQRLTSGWKRMESRVRQPSPSPKPAANEPQDPDTLPGAGLLNMEPEGHLLHLVAHVTSAATKKRFKKCAQLRGAEERRSIPA